MMLSFNDPYNKVGYKAFSLMEIYYRCDKRGFYYIKANMPTPRKKIRQLAINPIVLDKAMHNQDLR